MKKYPQIHVASKYQSFLQQLTTVGRPPSVDKAYIKKLGFKSSYDDNFNHAIKFIGLVEDKRGGAPTEKWTALRANLAGTLAQCLQLGYSDLFEFFPDAHLRDDEALNSYFRGNSDGSAEEVARMVTAFAAVRDIARFDGPVTISSTDRTQDKEYEEPRIKTTVKSTDYVDQGPPQTPHPTVNINIQLQLPSDATGEVYEKFFDAMKSKLFP